MNLPRSHNISFAYTCSDRDSVSFLHTGSVNLFKIEILNYTISLTNYNGYNLVPDRVKILYVPKFHSKSFDSLLSIVCVCIFAEN